MIWILSLTLSGVLVLAFALRSYLLELWKPKVLDEFTKSCLSDYDSVFILGHFYNFYTCTNDKEKWRTMEKYGREALKKGGITSFWIFNRPFIVVADPIAAELISKNCLNKDVSTKHILIDLMGNSTALVAIKDWQVQRKILVPVFCQKILVYNMPIFNKLGQIMVEKMAQSCGEVISIKEYIASHNINLLCELICGQRLTDQEQGLQIAEAYNKCNRLISHRLFNPILHLTPIYKWTSNRSEFVKNMNIVKHFIGKMIDEKEKEMVERQNSKTVPEDGTVKSLLEYLLDMKVYNRSDLSDEILLFFMGIVDTSSLAPCFVISLLSKHPDVQQKVLKELQEVMGDSGGYIDVDQIARLKYMDAVIKESLRLYPPGSVFVRHIEKDLTLPSGTVIPKGIGALLHTYAVHRNTAHWGTDAEHFKPERFLTGEKRHPGSYLAFSIGPRNCPGHRFGMMMVKTIIVYVLRSYEVLPVSAEDMKKPIDLKLDILLRDVDKFRVRLKPRVP